MTADAKLDRRIDFVGTLIQLQTTFPSPQFPQGTQAYTTDFGLVNWNGSFWENNTAQTLAGNSTITQAAGTPITAELCNVTAATAVAVTLPPSVPGNIITVHNLSAVNAVSVFPSAGGTGTEAINGGSANAALSIPASKSTQFTCATAGAWWTIPRVPS
jgi:hypothetical protein